MTTRLVKGMPVVSLADGTTLGAIDHVYFDPHRMAVVGFTFHQRNGLFGNGSSGLVDLSDVHAFGADAVTVDDVAVVRSDLAVAAGHEELIDLETLLKREVMTESGRRVGRVVAIQFGDASHALVALDVDVDGTPQRIAADRIKTVGAELIILADPQPAVVRSGRIVREITTRPTPDDHIRREHLKVVSA